MTHTTSFHPTLIEIIEDRNHGATELARRCLDILADCARHSKARSAEELLRELSVLSGVMRAARPSMAPLRTLVGCWEEALAQAPHSDLSQTREYMIDQADALKSRSLHAAKQVTVYASQVFQPGQTILTHSLSSILLGVFEALKDCGLRVVLTESRPHFESRRLAEHLSGWGYDSQIITDAQAGIFVGRSDAVLVGADSVLPDRSVINKSGTYLIALAAREAGVPFYVACESYKFECRNDSEILIEEGPVEELEAPELPNVQPRNITFDRTPAQLVTAWITDQGILRQDAADPQ